MPPETLEFEEPIAALLKEIEALSLLPGTDARQREISLLQRRLETTRADLYAALTPWQRVLVARHPTLHGQSNDHDRHCRVSRSACAARRSCEGPRHEGEDLSQLRLRAARGLSQGHARDSAG